MPEVASTALGGHAADPAPVWSVMYEQVIFLQLVREVLEDASYFTGRQHELEVSSLLGSGSSSSGSSDAKQSPKAAAATALLRSQSFGSFLLHLAHCMCTLTHARFQALESVAEKALWLTAVPTAVAIIGTSLALDVGDEGAPHVRRVSHSLASDTDVLSFCLQCLSSIPVLEGVADTHLEQVHGMSSIFSDPLAAQVCAMCVVTAASWR